MLDFIGFVIVGGCAGWAVGKISTSNGFGPVFDVLLGMTGGIVSGWIIGAVLGTLGHTRPDGLLAEFFVSVIGASLAVAVLHFIMREPIRPL